MKILVSACLLGCCCRYDGKSKADERVLALGKCHTLIPVCPEQLGGLCTPRLPAEIQGDKAIRKDGADVTAEYKKGAREALRLYELLSCDAAILKARSPSCGKGVIYDGTFTGTLTEGSGITAALFQERGLPVFTENEAEQI